ncbi:MAG: hypothetical protein WD689_04040 [Gaiellaceae bacterium]
MQAYAALEEGDEERAIALVREGVEKEERVRAWVDEDETFDPIRDRL